MKLPKIVLPAYLCTLLAVTVGGLLLLVEHKRFDTNMLSLLPAIHRDHAAEEALKTRAQALSSKVIVVVRGPSSREVEGEASRVAERLRSSDLFSRVDGRVSMSDLQPLKDFFARYPFQLVPNSSDNPSALQVLSEARARVFAPDGTQWLRYSETDPLLLLPVYINSIISDAGSFTLSNGFIHKDTASSRNVIIVAHVRDGIFSRSAQETIVGFLNTISVSPPYSLLTSGIIFFAQDSASRTESEVTTISTVTLVSALGLLLVCFRSLRITIALFTFISTSFLGATISAHLLTLRFLDVPIHLITLGFGSCLIGVCVDYALHFFVAHRLSSPQERRPPIARVASGILLGFTTTALAFLGIAFSPFPGLRQLAIFCVVGLLFAILTTFIVLPWIAGAPRYDARLARLARGTSFIFRPAMSRFTLVLVLILLACGIPQLKANDDIRTLHSPSPQLISSQRHVAELLGGEDAGTSIVIDGASEEETLQKEELIVERLERLRGEKRLGSYRSMSRLVPSRMTQERTYRDRARAFADDRESFRAYVNETHLSAQALTTLEKLSASAPTNYATPRECLTSGACRSIEDLWQVSSRGSVIASIALAGIVGDISSVTKGVPGARVVNQANAISQALRSYRISATETVLLFYVAVYVVLTLRYGIRRSWRVISPAFLAGAAAMATLGIFEMPLNVFSVFALVVLLGVGVDYAIFFAEEDGPSPATSLAVALSTITTIISFGALAISSTLALRCFGVVLASGVTFSALLAPLAQDRRRERY
jgi:predicted exporter